MTLKGTGAKPSGHTAEGNGVISANQAADQFSGRHATDSEEIPEHTDANLTAE